MESDEYNLDKDNFPDLPLFDDEKNDNFNYDNQVNDDGFNDIGVPGLEPDNIRFLQENQPEIFQLIMSLQRKIRNNNGKYVTPKGIKPIMNAHGIMDIYSSLNSFLTKIISLGKISDEEAHIRTKSFIKPFIIRLAMNKEKYELDEADMSSVVIAIDSLIYSQYTRSIGRGEANLLRGIYSVNESVKTDDSIQDKIRGNIKF